MKMIKPRRHSDLSLFDDFLNSFFNDNITDDSRLMPIDVLEFDKHYQLIADMPGVPKDNLKVSVKHNELMIESCIEKEENKENEVIHHRERFQGCYQRIIKLPDNCDVDSIKAKLNDGVLELTIQKIEPKPDKKILIES